MRLLDFYLEVKLRVLLFIEVHLDGDLTLQRGELWGGSGLSKATLCRQSTAGNQGYRQTSEAHLDDRGYSADEV